MEKNKIITDIDDLWINFVELRSTFPYPRYEYVGLTEIESTSYYQSKGFNYKLGFDHPLTPSDINRLRNMTYWLNQSVIIRLYTILEYNKVVSKEISINQNLDGWVELDILRRLRKYSSHTAKYNPEDKDQEKLFDKLVSHFGLYEYDKDKLPLHIDLVIEIIFKRVKRYVELYFG